jgi:hypothetical protein
VVFWLVAPVCVDGVERSPSTKASADVCGAGGVETGGMTEVVAAGDEMVVLGSLTTGTAADLCAFGTL